MLRFEPTVFNSHAAVGERVRPRDVVVVHDEEDVSALGCSLHKPREAVAVVNVGVNEDVVAEGFQVRSEQAYPLAVLVRRPRIGDEQISGHTPIVGGRAGLGPRVDWRRQ